MDVPCKGHKMLIHTCTFTMCKCFFKPLAACIWYLTYPCTQCTVHMYPMYHTHVPHVPYPCTLCTVPNVPYPCTPCTVPMYPAYRTVPNVRLHLSSGTYSQNVGHLRTQALVKLVFPSASQQERRQAYSTHKSRGRRRWMKDDDRGVICLAVISCTVTAAVSASSR